MKILFCLSESPVPPRNGFQLAVWHLLAALEGRHDVRILALSASDNGAPSRPSGRREHTEHVRLVDVPHPGVRGDAADLTRSLLLREPLRVRRVSRVMQPLVRRELTTFRPDVVHVSHSELARLGRVLTGQASVLACLDAWHRHIEANIEVSSGTRRIHERLQLPRVKRFEATEFARFRHLTTVTPEDAAALRELDPRLDVRSIPNGVELPDTVWSPRPTRAPQLLFHGAMGYAPNIAAARFLATDVLPRVRRTLPDAVVNLVGRSPAPEVERLAALDGVRVTGEVESLEPWMADASVYVCPMISGTGIKNKLLEAFAHGVPSVATPLALQGIAAIPERDVLVGSSGAELADQLVRGLTDPALAVALGARGRALVETGYTWDAVGRAYEEVYAAAIATRRS